jgi:hypothetical protein
MDTLTEKVLDGTITLTELVSEEFKKEIRTLRTAVENGKEQVVQAVKKVMKFVSKVSTGKQTINLVEFYKTGNKKQPLYIWPNFQTILDQATENGAVPEVEIDETFYQYQNTETVTDNDAMAKLKEAPIDLGTVEGRLEARKRLGAMAYFLKQQPKAEAGELLTNGYANVIGWFKTKSGSVLDGYCDWGSGGQKWYCDGVDLSEWDADRRFWSRNGEAQ